MKPQHITERVVYQYSDGAFNFKSDEMTMLAAEEDTWWMDNEHPCLLKRSFLFKSKTGRIWEQEDLYNDINGDVLYETNLETYSDGQAKRQFCDYKVHFCTFQEAFPDEEVQEC